MHVILEHVDSFLREVLTSTCPKAQKVQKVCTLLSLFLKIIVIFFGHERLELKIMYHAWVLTNINLQFGSHTMYYSIHLLFVMFLALG